MVIPHSDFFRLLPGIHVLSETPMQPLYSERIRWAVTFTLEPNNFFQRFKSEYVSSLRNVSNASIFLFALLSFLQRYE